ncbi:hypothetical protein [Krasilnikovia sp. MM14-A1259]|uniref:hypothetical protein n=1 Tax=Krasilnikovia sp. MM14-A1259 TaxID=3373539 RepID=UPI003810DB01
MGALHDLLNELDGARVHDVLVPGYIETAYGTPEFRPLGGTAYLHLDDRFLRIDGSENEGSLTLRMVDEITMPATLEREDDEFATASLTSLFFIDSGADPPITRIRYAVNDPADADRGVVRCAEFRIGSRSTLFFDPMSLERLRIAVHDGYDDWQRHDRDREVVGYVEEFVWEPEGSS